MKEIRTVYIPVERLCEIKYYIEMVPYADPHWRPEPSHVYKRHGKVVYFNSKEEAEIFIKNELSDIFFFDKEIREEVTIIE